MPIYNSSNYWILLTNHTAYAFGLNQAGRLVHTWWGPQLGEPSDYPIPPVSEGWASFNHPEQVEPLEYPAYAGMAFVEPCLKVTFADRVRDAVLQFTGAEAIAEEELVVHLRDAFYPLEVELHYRVYPEFDLIERWAVLHNQTAQTATIERVFSAQWHPPAGRSYRMTHLTGRWNDEFHLRQEWLIQGVKVLESRRLTTSHHHSPWFALDEGQADEDSGEVWFGTLAWSGNWKLAAEVTDFGTTRVSMGLNDWDFAWRLNPGERFTTPGCIAGYTRRGFGAASRRLHDLIRQRILPHGNRLHKVLYNSWEATTFNVDEQSQARLAEIAAGMGIELFVMDDGWFHGRNDDRAGLGDWWPDEKKFPLGLGPLVRRVNELGMDFGLWVEPEMVNPDSDLYRAHPDWILHFPNRTPGLGRNQCILNFARQDVQEYILARLDQLLSENNIAFIKWDMNRNVSEPGWQEAPGDPREVWVRYVQGLYLVWGELHRRYPHVIWQSCSGGGGRADLGILRLVDQIWVSDNTFAAARLGIQQGFSQVFPANVMEAWVTDADRGRIPLAFRFHVSMCGSLGVGGNLLAWSQAERAEAAQWIARYKELRPIIQLGDQYRLIPAQNSACAAVQYMDKSGSQGVLFAFATHRPVPAAAVRVRLRGLKAEGRYTVEGVPGARSGAAWMEAGLTLALKDFESTVREITAIG
jgi:alpha-galactosidase